MIEVASRNLVKAGCYSPRSRLQPAAGIKKTRKTGVSIPSGYSRSLTATYKVAVAPIHKAVLQRLSSLSKKWSPRRAGLVFQAPTRLTRPSWAYRGSSGGNHPDEPCFSSHGRFLLFSSNVCLNYTIRWHT